MRKLGKWGAVALLMITIGACTLPRGAALQSEVLNASTDAEATYQVVAVGPDNIETLQAWPQSGWHGHYHWLEARQGPTSPVIRSGDRITITIWDSQDPSLFTAVGQLNTILPEMTVSPGGQIFLPYVGSITVRGLTPDAARLRVQNELKAVAPSAQMQLAHVPGYQSTVDAVRGFAQPGTYPLPDRNFTILSLISQAGGISTTLRNPLVRLIRHNKTYEIRAKNLLEDAHRNIVLRGGDQIIVDEDDRTFVALGATGTEELVYFRQEHLTALEALAEVGGLAETRADLKGVLILREYSPKDVVFDASGPEKEQVVFTFDLTSADGLFAARKFRVNPDDVFIATESPVTSARTVLGLIGSVVGVGGAINNLSD